MTPDSDPEIRPNVNVAKTAVLGPGYPGQDRFSTWTERFEKFSGWRKLLSGIACLKRAAKRFKNKSDGKRELDSDVKAFAEAETFVVKHVQREFYGNNARKCRKELSPFLDEEGVVRVGGRLQRTKLTIAEKNPILIPGRHHNATIITRSFHEAIHHQGRHLTEGAIRAAGFWITGGKRLISHVIHRCIQCRKLRGSVCQQKMADLPSDRLTPSPPFTYVGVDVFGPWNIATRKTRGGSANSKRWALLLTCLTTRVIHIELLEEMTSSSFINALRRFYAVRGKVLEFRSDRGTNFVEDRSVKEFLCKTGVVWKFNPPHSSHFGGVWERMIGVARRILDSMLMDHNHNLTHEVLSTFMAEVSAIVNARPLVPVSTDVDSPFILSPATLLTQKTGSQVESFKHLNLKDMYKSQWKHVQVMAEQFWHRWRKEYLPLLQSRRKWTSESSNVKTGDVVLMKDEQVARNDWPLGVINRTFPSDDGLVRQVEVRVFQGRKEVSICPSSVADRAVNF